MSKYLDEDIKPFIRLVDEEQMRKAREQSDKNKHRLFFYTFMGVLIGFILACLVR